ncbi:aminoglycoside 6-adenylyltransferase [Marinicaulis aureus]|uniref:Aminoglycoside 6-adenylyltransferase n=1 Tax=Hyphococcus aureus TaxID=2666033 RepID=A0ABW1KTV8_9PROT
MTSTLTPSHQNILDNIQAKIRADDRFLGLLAGGSLIHGGVDEFSDLDLVLVVADAAYDALMAQRLDIAEQFGDLLAAFTGEHVGEPRLLICLYGPDTIHVDLKFIVPGALSQLIEHPLVLFDRDGSVEALLGKASVRWPDQNIDWFEERFWIWVHYGATKLGRGELFEAIGMLAFIRDQVLGPLCYMRENQPQRGIRRIEQKFPSDALRLKATLAAHDRNSVKDALQSAMTLYEELTADQLPPDTALRKQVRTYVQNV